MKIRSIMVLIILSLLTIGAKAQNDKEPLTEIEDFQKELNDEFKNESTSPLSAKDRKKFKGHTFFPIDMKYRVTGKLDQDASPFFGMPTSKHEEQAYRTFGYVTFTIDGAPFRLPVYQSKRLMATKEYEDYLFFPFTDLTNGKTTYSGGRYLGLRIPADGSEVIIDFNQAYNPYCAYSDRFSCPIVPKENHLAIDVKAGVMELGLKH